MDATIKTAVIPAGGKGKRFLPVTRAVPKEMLPIWNIPAIQFAIDEARWMGIENIVLVISPSKSIIANYYRNQADVRVVCQDNPTGLGDAVFRVRHLVHEPFAVLLPDVIIRKKCKRLLRETFGVMVNRVLPDDVEKYGIVRMDGNHLIGAVEKPSREKAPSDLAISGRYVLPTDIFSELLKCTPGMSGEIQLTEAIDRLAQKRPAKAVEIDAEDVIDIGTPAGMAYAWKLALERRDGFEKNRGFDATNTKRLN